MDQFAHAVEAMEGVTLTKIFFTDLEGRVRALTVNPSHIRSIMEKGVGFDGSSIAGIATVDDSDRLLIPAPESLRTIEFPNGRMAFFIGTIWNAEGGRSRTDARAVLERVLRQARDEFGYTFLSGPEHEFFLLGEDQFAGNLHTDRAGYFHTDPADRGEIVRNRVVEILEGCGIRHEKAHHEVTPSQHEINLEPAPPLEAADRTILFNYILKKVAGEHGLHATLMPKPFDGMNRNAFHIHLSMQDENGVNAFHDPAAEHNLSQVARRFFGGIIKYARQTSLIMASTINSYKAYMAEREAPVVVGWGRKNRSSLVRMPHALSPEATRLELRSPDPAGNVYLQFAALIGMGLQGLRENLDCGAPDIGSTYKKLGPPKVWDERFLPKSMYEALVEAERGEFLRELLGERLFERYLRLKYASWEDFRTSVTEWEYRNYLIC